MPRVRRRASFEDWRLPAIEMIVDDSCWCPQQGVSVYGHGLNIPYVAVGHTRLALFLGRVTMLS